MSKCTCPGQGICKSWGFVLICFKVPKQVQERPVQDNWGFNIVLNSLSVPGETQAKPSLCFCKTQSYLCAKTSKRSSKKSMCNCRDQTRKKKKGGGVSPELSRTFEDIEQVLWDTKRMAHPILIIAFKQFDLYKQICCYFPSPSPEPLTKCDNIAVLWQKEHISS